MGLIRFNYKSQALGYYVDVTIAIPTAQFSYYDLAKQSEMNLSVNQSKKLKYMYKPGMKFQTVYLIHGGGDNDSIIYRYTNIERYAQENNVMLVTPNIANSFGINTQFHIDYETFLVDELPVVVQSLFPSSSKRDDNFILGFAMGGNVALATAIKNQDKYHTCIDMSGGIGLTLDTEKLKREVDSDHFKNGFKLFSSSFGTPEDIEKNYNIYNVAKERFNSGKQLTKFIFICGEKEFIRKRVEDDVRIMREIGYDIDYLVMEGFDHDYDMWDTHCRLAFNKLLPLKKEAIYE